MKEDLETGRLGDGETGQLALPLKLKTARTPEQLAELSTAMAALLADGQPRTALEICRELGLPRAEDGKRIVRKLGELGGDVLSFPGSHGYALKSAATSRQLFIGAKAFIDAAKALIQRGIALRRLAGLKLAQEQLTMSDHDRELAAYVAGEDAR